MIQQSNTSSPNCAVFYITSLGSLNTQVYTNSSGQYLINLAQSTAAYSNGDVIKVYCQVGNIIDVATITVDTRSGEHVVNFAITRRSGLTDGLKGSSLSSGKGGLNRELVNGCTDGLK